MPVCEAVATSEVSSVQTNIMCIVVINSISVLRVSMTATNIYLPSGLTFIHPHNLIT